MTRHCHCQGFKGFQGIVRPDIMNYVRKKLIILANMCDSSCAGGQAPRTTAGQFTCAKVHVALDSASDRGDFLSQFRRHLARYARPQWSDRTVLGVKVFADGMTNAVIGVFDEGAEEDGIVLIRLYGKSSELFINREREVLCMQLMNQAGYAPPLYCQFTNGLCCGFVPGRCITVPEMGEPAMMRRIAVCLAQVHSVKVTTPIVGDRPAVWDMCEWITRVPSSFSDAGKDLR